MNFNFQNPCENSVSDVNQKKKPQFPEKSGGRGGRGRGGNTSTRGRGRGGIPTAVRETTKLENRNDNPKAFRGGNSRGRKLYGSRGGLKNNVSKTVSKDENTTDLNWANDAESEDLKKQELNEDDDSNNDASNGVDVSDLFDNSDSTSLDDGSLIPSNDDSNYEDDCEESLVASVDSNEDSGKKLLGFNDFVLGLTAIKLSKWTSEKEGVYHIFDKDGVFIFRKINVFTYPLSNDSVIGFLSAKVKTQNSTFYIDKYPLDIKDIKEFTGEKLRSTLDKMEDDPKIHHFYRYKRPFNKTPFSHPHKNASFPRNGGRGRGRGRGGFVESHQ